MKTVNWHNAHLGARCLLVCNGPSFKDVDPAVLRGRGRITIGVNNVYPRFCPDYWHGLDGPECFDAALFSEPFPKICRAGMDTRDVGGTPLAQCLSTYFLDLRAEGNFWDWSEKSVFHWGKNSMLSALQLALWMGMRDIALVGVDLHHKAGDYADGNYLRPTERASNARLYDASLALLRDFVPQAATLGVKMTSCSPQSKLNEIMPYRPVAEIVAECEQGIATGRAQVFNRRQACCAGKADPFAFFRSVHCIHVPT